MFLLIFGIFTLVRIVHRNLVSHEELRAAGRIRRYFVDKDPEIARYLYYEPYDDKPFRKKEWKDIASIGTGGLVETVMLINSFIAAILAGITLINYFNLKLDFAGGICDILFDGSSQFISAFIVPLLIVLASIISWYFHPIPNFVVGIAGFLFAWTSQFIFVKLRYDKGRPEKSKIKYPSDIKGGSK